MEDVNTQCKFSSLFLNLDPAVFMNSTPEKFANI